MTGSPHLYGKELPVHASRALQQTATNDATSDALGRGRGQPVLRGNHDHAASRNKGMGEHRSAATKHFRAQAPCSGQRHCMAGAWGKHSQGKLLCACRPPHQHPPPGTHKAVASSAEKPREGDSLDILTPTARVTL